MNNSHKISSIIIIVVMFFILFPVFILGIWSFVDRWVFPDLFPHAFSLHGLKHICSHNCYQLSVLLHSMIIAMIVGILATVVGTMTARALTNDALRFKNILSYLAILPILVPAVAVSMGVHMLFIRMGISDTVWGVVLIHLICALPYTVKIMSDVCDCVGVRLEEQAQSLGCSKKKSFFMVTLPVISPGIFSAIFMGYIISFSQYFLTLIIGGGTIQTFSTLMVPYMQNGDRTLSSGYSLMFLLSTIFIFALADYVRRKLLPYQAPLLLF